MKLTLNDIDDDRLLEEWQEVLKLWIYPYGQLINECTEDNEGVYKANIELHEIEGLEEIIDFLDGEDVIISGVDDKILMTRRVAKELGTLEVL